MPDVFLPYGVNANNEYVHISQTNSGRAPGLKCPYCGQPLIARKGDVVSHHYAHDGDSCRIARRDYDALDVPAFDDRRLFDLSIDRQLWDALERWHKGQPITGAEQTALYRGDFLEDDYNPYGGYQLTETGRIVLGACRLDTFADWQLGKIFQRHNELADTVERCEFGKPGPFGKYTVKPRPAETDTALTNLNIYRAQVRRRAARTLYLFEIVLEGGQRLHKIGVTTDVERRLKDVRRAVEGVLGGVQGVQVVRTAGNRGTVERFALHRYRNNRRAVGNFTEYFAFDDKTLRQVKGDFTRLGDFDLLPAAERLITTIGNPHLHAPGLLCNILDGLPSQIEQKVTETRADERHRRATVEGMQQAKQAGKHIGRPAKSTADLLNEYAPIVELLERRAAGEQLSLRAIAQQAGVSLGMVQKVKRAMNT